MSLSFQVHLQPKHVREATRGIFLQQVLKPMVLWGVVILMLLAQGLLWAMLPKVHWTFHVTLAVLLLLSVVGTFYTAGRYYETLALRNFRRFEGVVAEARLDEEGYHYQASWGSGTIAWSRIDSLWCLKGVWVLLEHVEKGVSVLLPVADLDVQAQAYLKERLTARGAQVRA